MDIALEVAEQENVANILVSTFASQIANRVTATTEEEANEHTIGLQIASKQLGSFISNLIAENGNLKMASLKEA